MKIEPQYDIGKEMWFLSYNHPRKARICGMRIYIAKSGKITILYSLTEKDVHWYKREQDLFSSKEELLKSL